MTNNEPSRILACPTHFSEYPRDLLGDSLDEIEWILGRRIGEDSWQFSKRRNWYIRFLKYKAYLKEISMRRIKRPSKVMHLYLDKNGMQYLNEKPVYEEIEEIPEGVDHFEFRIRLLEARDSILSNLTISTAMMATQFSDQKPTNRDLTEAASFSFHEFLSSLESWNYVDEKDNLIQITEDAIHDLPKWIYNLMFTAADKINNPKN